MTYLPPPRRGAIVAAARGIDEFTSWLLYGYETWLVAVLWQMNISLAVFNMIPFYPLDGGRVLQGILSRRVHPNRAQVIVAKVGIGGGVLLIVGGLFTGALWGGILVAIGISNILACRQALVAARYQESPYGGPDYLAPWQTDPDGWKRGASGGGHGGGWSGGGRVSEIAGEKRPGWFARRRERKRRELEAEVDRILAKITEVGMDGLSWREKRTLERASREAQRKQ